MSIIREIELFILVARIFRLLWALRLVWARCEFDLSITEQMQVNSIIIRDRA